jgi:hypothetical protein
MHSLKRGYVREDGYTFLRWSKRRDGTPYPLFLSPKALLRERLSTLNARCRGAAKREDVPFDITPDYLVEIFTPRCPVFDILLEFGHGSGGRDNSPSLDRRVPALGYVRGNVAFISNRANRLKGGCTIEQLEKLVAHIKGGLH